MGTEKSAVLLLTNQPRATGRLSYNTFDKQVNIKWLYEVQGLTDGLIPKDPSLATSTQILSLDFWPTEAISAGPLRIVVAGLTPQGSNVTQVITLDPLTELPQVAIDPVTGVSVTPDLTFEVEDKTTIRRMISPAPKHVLHMWNNRGASDRVFAMYSDTHEIVEIDLQSGQVVKSVAVQPSHPSPDPGAMVLPGLDRSAHAYIAASDGDHVTQGYIYWLHSPNSDNEEMLFLIDSDRDGAIDASSFGVTLPLVYSSFSSFLSKR